MVGEGYEAQEYKEGGNMAMMTVMGQPTHIYLLLFSIKVRNVTPPDFSPFFFCNLFISFAIPVRLFCFYFRSMTSRKILLMSEAQGLCFIQAFRIERQINNCREKSSRDSIAQLNAFPHQIKLESSFPMGG